MRTYLKLLSEFRLLLQILANKVPGQVPRLFQLCRATKNYIGNPRISILPQVFGPPWLAAGIVSDLRLGCDPIQIENWAPPSWSGSGCKIGPSAKSENICSPSQSRRWPAGGNEAELCTSPEWVTIYSTLGVGGRGAWGWSIT